MKKKIYELSDFLRDFPTEYRAWEYLLAVKCPYVKLYKRPRGNGYSDRLGRYYSPLAGTVFAGIRLSLDKWFFAVFLLHYSPMMSINELSRRLDVTYQTAMKIKRKISPLVDRRKGFIRQLRELVKDGIVE